MPIKIPYLLPAREILEEENIFIMDENRANTQDIRPLNILILNLMPEKQKTEVQILRLLGNTPLQLNISFLRTASYESKNTSPYHLEQFYTSFEQIKNNKYDGMIITGAPIELLKFEDVQYWKELTDIMEWSKNNVTSTLHLCWGAQAALYYHFDIHKYELDKKCYGVFSHYLLDPSDKLLRGFDDNYLAPHSRHTDVQMEEIMNHPDLKLLSASEEAGAFIISGNNGKQIMVTGHLEYDSCTLADEYTRDQAKGLDTDLPIDYFPNDDPNEKPLNSWRSHAYLLFSNWLNYFVYQQTPYDWK
ncbi:homoserine O-acetyltransferase MetA [Niallia sp. 01092]|uniref:homoserine O-acetyltransferase MetA n=1 Tax=unclassified Niallia TaxID=2837522 RepID=UPI003FD629B0